MRDYKTEYDEGIAETIDIINNGDRFDKGCLIGMYGFYQSPLQQEALKTNPHLQALGDYVTDILTKADLPTTPEGLRVFLNIEK